MTDKIVKIIMGSDKDFDFCENIGERLEEFGVPYEYRVASAHKTPEKVLKILKEDKGDKNIVYVTVAGRSNTLSGFVDANTHRPVIACPPYSSKFGGADIFSSLRMPSGSGLVTLLEPGAAAIAAAKMLALEDRELEKKIKQFQEGLEGRVEEGDEEVRRHGKC